jgi:hypothetical protein
LFDPKLATITEPIGITASISSQTNVLCFDNTGSATVSATEEQELNLFMGYYTITTATATD